jgi:uncharacterized phage protein (TIGR02218 family)
MSNIEKYENSIQNGIPIECYKFSHMEMQYLYTSAAKDIELQIMENEKVVCTEKYYAEVISRDTIKPGSSSSIESCVIKVSKDHPIAKLFQGAPPEFPVTCKVYRLHAPDTGRFDIELYARIGQAHFVDSECELTATMENWLNKELPNGVNQYYCNHVLFDHNCKLRKEDYQISAFIDKVDGLLVYSSAFEAYKDGYFEGGRLYYNENVRMIAEHKGNRVRLKYPFVNTPRNTVMVLPGCNSLFTTCALRYKNSLNFSGVPYVAPTDATKNPTGKGAYWIDSLVVQRDTDGFVGTIDL